MYAEKALLVRFTLEDARLQIAACLNFLLLHYRNSYTGELT